MFGIEFAEAIASRRKMGLLIFGETADLLHCSALAEEQLSEIGVSVLPGMLSASHLQYCERISNAVSQCYRDKNRCETWISLGDDALDALDGVVLSLQYFDQSGVAVVLGLLRSPGYDDSVHDQPRVIEAFGLTPREAQLSLHLSRGKDLNDFAAGHFLTINTVKTHLKQLFKKLGVNKQIQVAVLVWAALR